MVKMSCPPRCWWSGAAAVLILVVVSRYVAAQTPPDPEVGDPYPLETCVVLEAVLDENAEILTVNGVREIRVCCEECVNEFYGSSYTWIGVVDDRIKQQQRDWYPLERCLVDGAPLDGLGTIDFVFRNRLFRVCSANCRREVEQHPAKYFAKLDAAVVAKQKPQYPLARCIVTGKPLGEKAVDLVVANQLVRLADADAVDKFNEAPGKYLAQLRRTAARAQK